MKKLDCAGAIIDIELAGIDVLGAYVALTVTLDPHGAQHPFPGGNRRNSQHRIRNSNRAMTSLNRSTSFFINHLGG